MDGAFKPAMPETGPREHVLVIGGGASGVLMAAHLLRQPGSDLDVTVIERGALLGCGIAYGTDNPAHRLNTRVSQMSALPDDPAHFAQWLAGQGLSADPQSFVDRGTYGRYLASLLAPWQGGESTRLRCLRGECLRLSTHDGGVRAELDDGRTIRATRAILATGHAVPAAPPAPLSGAWDFRPPADTQASVAIIGTGLSMVDHVVTLLGAGHRGPILCLSRRGLLPQAHQGGTPLATAPDDIPLGAPVSRLLHWLRGRARRAEAAGGTWRDAVDGIRPHVALIWQSWSLAERARFLRHAATWWEVHRHRMPQISAAQIETARASGQLQILRGSFLDAEPDPEGRIHMRMRITPAGEGGTKTLTADRVIDCRGIRRDPERHAAPVIRDLLARGAARLDPLALGLDTTPSARVIDGAGHASTRLFAIGPAARGTLWEITAIPDIREQSFALAHEIVAMAAESGTIPS
ncbi:MAG: FAD/NAD(P)-binding protein [Paracoccus sp. (in: a-proteobacteria)]|nr:FAD/NAD(P)-binding protein [Paracoccus sp. (in: a-proteobacteria)]